MNPASFLKEFDTILFDMDGVITSERTYWDCAALSSVELAFDKRYFGTKTLNLAQMGQQAQEVADRVFCGDDTIVLLKNYGVNTNWDLAYLMFAGILGLDCGEDFKKVYDHYKQVDLRVPDLYTHAEELLQAALPDKDCARLGEIWTMVQVAFNEWYCGSEGFRETFGYEASDSDKQAMMQGEEPLHSLAQTQELLKTLHTAGFRLGVGTGRPREEFRRPAENWDIMQYFEPSLCITYDELAAVQKKFQHVSLAKPHPYTFAKAVLGDSCSDFELAHGKYDKKQMEKVLVVGDAGADLFAAKEMGAKFAAVLTGVNGQASRTFFEVQGADFILNSVLNLIEA
ncbi:MAG: HAD family hydrolase [Clostridia bacterium]|nr:HAD family hydrolase [Clostridia bacterium]